MTIETPLDRAALQAGQWISIRARVASSLHRHPDEIQVTLRSHNEDYTCPVANEFLIDVVEPPRDWPRCTAGLRTTFPLGDKIISAILQCSLPIQHPGQHCEADRHWDEDNRGLVYVSEEG